MPGSTTGSLCDGGPHVDRTGRGRSFATDRNTERNRRLLMDITATFRLTEADFRTAIRNSPAVRGISVFGVLFFMVGLLTLLVGTEPRIWLVITGPVILAFAELVVVRQAARKSAPLLAEPWTVRITDQNYALSTAVSQAEVAWSAYRQVTARSGFWYLQQTNKAVAFIPQHAFDAAQLAQVSAFFADRLPPLKRPWYLPFA
ncbi:YcxB family protein [Kitasatospora sp. NPDC058190]|uniref:YcxB family protein n=1 Tax=Kitasatospora sp. NPDC058190 TaxID=3346371 RepID=UPI0036D83B37